MKLTTVFALLGACSFTAYGATVETLLNDIAVIGNDASKINTLVQSYPQQGGTVPGAVDIHNAITSIVVPIKNATSNAITIKPVPVSNVNASKIVAALNGIFPSINDHLKRLIILRPSFVALPVKGFQTIILQDLVTLNQGMPAFRSSINSIVPKLFLNQTDQFFLAVVADFNATIAAYSVQG